MYFLPLIAGLAAPALASRLFPRTTYPVIDTAQGYVQGGPSDYRSGITVYKGIPFAAPPTGQNRWKAPSAPANHTGVLNATSFSLQCAQSANSQAGIFDTGLTTSSEDCLYLNIWTPTYNDTSDLASKNLPVYVWIFGGRFEGGSGDVKTYDGSGLASKDIIVVTLNYRLGMFGFLAHPDLSAESGHNASGNYGIMDQQAAIRWVKANIANFGGNSSQITVGGQSAGSASALDMMYSPLAKGLVQGCIAESGARGPHDPMTGGLATAYRTKAQAESDGVALFASLNITSLAQLRNLSTDAIVAEGNLSDDTYDNTQFASLSGDFMNPPIWRPVIDGYVLTHGYGEALSLGSAGHADIPILTGNNADESGASTTSSLNVSTYTSEFSAMLLNQSSQFLALYPASNETQAASSANNFFRDLSRYSTWKWAADWAAGGATSNVYTYYWNRAPAENEASGAYHGSELWYVFNNIPYADYSNVTWTSEDYVVEGIMSEYWVNFIRTGNPNGSGSGNNSLVAFPPTVNTTTECMWLGDQFGSGPLAETNEVEKLAFLASWFKTLQEY